MIRFVSSVPSMKRNMVHPMTNLTMKSVVLQHHPDYLLMLRGRSRNTSSSSSSEVVIPLSDYTYDLKMQNIAKYPAEPRGSSRLLRVDRNGTISHYDNFSTSFPSLAQNSLLILNESRVVKARLFVTEGNNTNSTSIEMMILSLNHDVISSPCHGAKFNVMIRKEPVQEGDVFVCNNIQFQVIQVNKPWLEEDHCNGTDCIVECHILSLDGTESKSVSEVLEEVGSVPIPPYLGREVESMDELSYNNVYASQNSGSVAAPTAGLHFTNDVLQQIGYENLCYLSLHVGAGTFQPIMSTDNVRNHTMHGENYAIHRMELERILSTLQQQQQHNDKRIIVVGTTSCRTLESLYWSGVKILTSTNNKEEDIMTLGQEEWISLSNKNKNISNVNALEAVLEHHNGEDIIQGRTSLMIVPKGYTFPIVDELVTNFHAPDSTLMLLVSAFYGSGTTIKHVYEEAKSLGCRFLSYGDICFFSKQN